MNTGTRYVSTRDYRCAGTKQVDLPLDQRDATSADAILLSSEQIPRVDPRVPECFFRVTKAGQSKASFLGKCCDMSATGTMGQMQI